MSYREGLYNAIYETYRDVYGSRPSMHTYQLMSDDELKHELSMLQAELIAQIRDEEVAEEDAWNNWLEYIREKAAEFGGILHSKMIRWDMEAEGITNGDVDHYAYCKGLSYMKVSEIRRMLQAESM